MDVETSQRMAYAFNPFDLSEEQADYVEDELVNSESFDQIPADVLHILYQMEAKYGVSPAWQAKVEAQQKQIDDELDD